MLRTELRKVLSSQALPLDLEAIKLDLRVDSSDENATLERMIRGAAAFLERRTGWAVIPARYHAVYSEWPCGPQEIYRAPLRDLLDIEYLSAANTWSPVDVADFQVSRRQKSFIVQALTTFEAPSLFTDLDSVRFVFDAGFDIEGDDSSGIDSSFHTDESDPLPMDDDVRVLLTMLVGHWYQNRELFLADKMTEIEERAGSLLGAHRTHW
jgi:uncharacterized phiE125 gp8 family phage protein